MIHHIPPIKMFLASSVGAMVVPAFTNMLQVGMDLGSDPTMMLITKVAEGGLVTTLLGAAVYFLWRELNNQRKLTEQEREKHREMLDLHKSVVEKIDDVDRKVDLIKDRLDRGGQ